MAMIFGQMDFNVAFKPTSAFPLDAREYFESYAEAQAAAQTAVEAGSADSRYYYGQVLRVVENGVAALYQIQPDNTLASVVNGAALDAVKQRVDALDKEGGVIDILTGRVSDLEDDFKGIEDEIANQIAKANHLKFKIAESKEAIDANAELADTYIYLVAKSGEGDDVYDEYMIIGGKVELIGHTKVDLTEYAKTADIESAYVKKANGARLMLDTEGEKLAELLGIKSVSDEFVVDENGMLYAKTIIKDKISGLSDELNKKIDKETGKRLMTDAEGTKLAALMQIESVSDEFVVGDDGMLSMQSIDKSKVSGLSDEFNKKVDKVTGSRLITELEAQKIEKLVLNEDGSVGLSGTVNAENVQGLDTLLNKKLEKVMLGTTALEVVNQAVAIPVAGADLGVVKTNATVNGVEIAETGEMTVHSLNVNKLVQSDDEVLVLNGGAAQG